MRLLEHKMIYVAYIVILMESSIFFTEYTLVNKIAF